VDFALKHFWNRNKVGTDMGFNPCFGGFCSKTWQSKNKHKRHSSVSILVLVDFALKLYTMQLNGVSVRFQSLFWWILL